MEELMNFSVRAFQLKFRLAGCDMFALYGSLRKIGREDISAVERSRLADFKLAFEPEVVQPSVGEDPRSEGESLPESELFDVED